MPDKPRMRTTIPAPARIMPALALLGRSLLLGAGVFLVSGHAAPAQERPAEITGDAAGPELLERARRELARGLSELYENRREGDGVDPEATGSLTLPTSRKVPLPPESDDVESVFDPNPLGSLQSLSRSPGETTRKEAVAAPPEPQAVRPRQVGRGIAAWYNLNDRTANGEHFDPNQFTAGHLTLAFGTKVQVVNERTGRSVTVRINDRGPWTKGRIIDLSKAAAQAIGMDGIDEVALYVLDAPAEHAKLGER